jgi:type II secretion system protein H
MKDTGLHRNSSGFTLIELIVVMTLLTVVLSIAAPRLGGFLSGRDVREEARRMLSLTRYARAEAAERGERMQVYFDTLQSRYGIRSDESNLDDSTPAVEFTCQEGFTLEAAEEDLDADGVAVIVFWPDGTIEPDSAERVELWEKDRFAMALVRLDAGLDYVLETE